MIIDSLLLLGCIPVLLTTPWLHDFFGKLLPFHFAWRRNAASLDLLADDLVSGKRVPKLDLHTVSSRAAMHPE